VVPGLTATLAHEVGPFGVVVNSLLHRMVTEDEVAAAVLAMLVMPGLCGADIDLSAGMIAR
jgi:hypothetical protein